MRIRIRILPFSLMRIRILPFNLMRVRILPLTYPRFGPSSAPKCDPLRLPPLHFDADPGPLFAVIRIRIQLSTLVQMRIRIQLSKMTQIRFRNTAFTLLSLCFLSNYIFLFHIPVPPFLNSLFVPFSGISSAFLPPCVFVFNFYCFLRTFAPPSFIFTFSFSFQFCWFLCKQCKLTFLFLASL
jgi:hypothetical protein